jgi:hypothetical protein
MRQCHALTLAKACYICAHRMHDTHNFMPQFLRLWISSKHFCRISAANAAHDESYDNFTRSWQWLFHVQYGNAIL